MGTVSSCNDRETREQLPKEESTNKTAIQVSESQNQLPLLALMNLVRVSD
ncbi:hypothetical protein SAMN04487950_2775 [Halogranum rubrum]|uniref:Uncharacterized protein n=1 Tax=Halogranum rubrum TaxID=553466 RepID=A0A1I4FCG9_9EURY|nr:hypothetical protein SAMN04487950_2775 [Halogranum rubrum]